MALRFESGLEAKIVSGRDPAVSAEELAYRPWNRMPLVWPSFPALTKPLYYSAPVTFRQPSSRL